MDLAASRHLMHVRNESLFAIGIDPPFTPIVCEVARLKGSTVGGAFIPFTRRRLYAPLHVSDPHSHHTTNSQLIGKPYSYHHAQDHRKHQFPLRHPVAKARDSNPQQPPHSNPCPSRCPIQEEFNQHIRFAPSLSLPLYPRKRLCLSRRSINPPSESCSSPCQSLARFIGYGCPWICSAQYAGL